MSKIHTNRFFVFLAALTIVCLLSTHTISFAGENALIQNIKLTNNRDHLITYFKVQGAFTEEITQAILKGVPTSFSFYISIYKTKDGWFDKKLSDLKLTSTMKYNSMKKEFSISRPWKEEESFVTKSFEEAKGRMTEINNVKIVSLKTLQKGEKYQIRIKAELDRITLPLYLHYVFFFVSLWDFETDWYIINFTY